MEGYKLRNTKKMLTSIIFTTLSCFTYTSTIAQTKNIFFTNFDPLSHLILTYKICTDTECNNETNISIPPIDTKIKQFKDNENHEEILIIVSKAVLNKTITTFSDRCTLDYWKTENNLVLYFAKKGNKITCNNGAAVNSNLSYLQNITYHPDFTSIHKNRIYTKN